MTESLSPPRLDGRAALRFGIALILLWFGYMKFLPYEAEGVRGIAEDYWLFGWLYPLVGVGGASAVIGVLEVTAGVLTAAAQLDPPALRSLDAIQLASALLLGDELEVFVAYDERLLAAASALGMPVAAPGSDRVA